MASTVKNTFVFTRNPVWLNMADSGLFRFVLYGPDYGSTSGYEPLYEGIVTAPALVNIAELLEAHVPKTADPGEESTDLLIALQTFTEVTIGDDESETRSENSVTVQYYDNDDEQQFSLTLQAFVGGVSKQNWRKLQGYSTDIFEQRFMQSGCNFFMTTRTNDWRIVMKETELYPLCFLYPNSGTLKIKELLGEHELALAGTAQQLYALNLAAVRKYFFTNYGIITNVFEVYTDDTFDCRIAIEEADAAPERYRLKFRNSYGVFETLQVTASASATPSMDSEHNYTEYDEDVDDFVSARGRNPISTTIDVESGPKTKDEIRFLLDAVNSDEVYLLDMCEDPVKVIPTMEDASYRVYPDGMQSLSLKLLVCDEDAAVMEEIADQNTGKRMGVFSEEFTDVFN